MECSEPLCMTCADAHKRNKYTLQHEVIFASTGYEICRRKGQNLDDKDEFHEYTDMKNKVKELLEMNEQNEKQITVHEKEVINAIAEHKQEIQSKVLQMEYMLKKDLSSKIDECKLSYSAQKEELLKIQRHLQCFHKHLESMQHFSKKKSEPGENLAEELFSIKQKLETTKATLQRFKIIVKNTKVIRIQQLGAVEIIAENYICETNENHENSQGHITEPNKRINVFEQNIELRFSNLCSKIQRSSLQLQRKRFSRATFKGSTVAVKKYIENDHHPFGKEVNILMVASHENVTKMIGVSIDELPYFLVMEYLIEYSLKEVIFDNPALIDTSINNLTEIVSKIANGMNYLGSREINHSDLRADNILFGSYWTPKVYGFKFAHMANDHTIDPKRRRTIPPVRWLAQEIIDERKATTKSDVWSFGILLIEVFGRCKQPYPELNDQEVFEKIKRDLRHTRPECCPEDIYDHALSCWSKHPDDRLTFESIFNYFHNYDIDKEHGYDEVKEVDENDSV